MKIVVLIVSILSFLASIVFQIFYWVGSNKEDMDAAFKLMVIGWLMLITSFHID